MSQKRNKIILLLGIVLILILLIVGHQKWWREIPKHSPESAAERFAQLPESERLNIQYGFCKMLYLGKPQRYSNGRISIPPQVFCRVANNKVTLIKNDQVKDDIKSGDTIILVVDLSKLFKQEHFNIMADSNKSLSVPKVPKDNFNVCVSYKPSFATFVTNVGPFKGNKYLDKSTSYSCFFVKSLSDLRPIGMIVKIPQDNTNEALGMRVFLPTKDLHTPSPLDIKKIIQNKQFFTLYEMTVFSH